MSYSKKGIKHDFTCLWAAELSNDRVRRTTTTTTIAIISSMRKLKKTHAKKEYSCKRIIKRMERNVQSILYFELEERKKERKKEEPANAPYLHTQSLVTCIKVAH